MAYFSAGSIKRHLMTWHTSLFAKLGEDGNLVTASTKLASGPSRGRKI